MSAARTREKPVVMKAETWDGESDPRGMLATEKYNGWRFFFDPDKGVFRTATGHVYATPREWAESMPKVPADGEFWLGRGRGTLQRVASIVATGLDGPLVTGLEAKRWAPVQAIVFDLRAPDAGPWEERRRILESALGKDRPGRPPWAVLAPQTEVKDRDHLDAMMEAIVEQQGEGLMLRKPGSGYSQRRVPWLLKVKRWLDAEARVVGHTPGERACAGMMGALQCRMGRQGDGIAFEIGTGFTHDQRRSPPAVGSLVRFRYEELSEGGKPLKPSYRGVRHEEE